MPGGLHGGAAPSVDDVVESVSRVDGQVRRSAMPDADSSLRRSGELASETLPYNAARAHA